MTTLFISCEDAPAKQDASPDLLNTLTDSDLGGKTGYIDDYFYNFNKDVNADYYRFTSSYFTFGYEQYLNLFQEEPPSLKLRTFPEYLVKISPQENIYTERTLIDSLSTDHVIQSGKVLISSVQFKNLESLVWDTDAEIDAQRYKPNNSDWNFDTTTVSYKDTMDIRAYSAVIDTPVIDQGVLFVDQAEWVDTTYEYFSDDRLAFNYIFHFQRKQLSRDSLMFRLNTDCNDNGVWDEAENVDTGNGQWDMAEPFYDTNEDGIKDGNEPFEDRNCNGIWDDFEPFTDANSNNQYDQGEAFEDLGNNILDSDEVYTDLNGNGQPDSGELFLFNPIPNRLLVTWADPTHPRVLNRILPGDSLVTRWGQVYHNIIELVDFADSKTVTVTDVDSLVTLYTNQVVAHLVGGSGGDDYLIVKTEWEDNNTDGKDYDYLLFKNDEYIYKLVKPSFFKPYGYYWSEGQIQSGFWFKNQFEDEIMYYTVNGLLREGESVETSYFDTTTVAIYKIDRSFRVDVEDVMVPAKKIRGSINQNGNVECFANPAWPAVDISDCPGADTTFADAFKITNILTQTMIGTDVEYGEKSITWLVKGLGVVKDELYIRWTEYPMSQGEQWVGLSRWELGKMSPVNGNRLNRLLNRARTVQLQSLHQIPELEDPFQVRRTTSFQRTVLPK